jgi:serine/threonine protein kinase
MTTNARLESAFFPLHTKFETRINYICDIIHNYSTRSITTQKNQVRMSSDQHTIVGSGGSGCVVCPPFNYNALDSQNCVGKVIQREVSKEVVEEWNNAVALHNIPNANEYFVYPFQWNYVDRQKFENMFNISAHTDNEQLLQYIMPNSGRELRKCIKENNIAPSKIVEYMLQIAQGVELLQTHKLVHNDLHLSNVMLHNDKPLICDLSVMTTFKGFYEDRLTQGCIFDPFEVKILSDMGFDDDIPIKYSIQGEDRFFFPRNIW